MIKARKPKQSADQTKRAWKFNNEVKEKIQEFEAAVNMTAHEIENWLATDESNSVGWENESGEIIGRQSVQAHCLGNFCARTKPTTPKTTISA